MTKVFSLLVLATCLVTTAAQAQRNRRLKPLLNPGKPAVFVSFLRGGLIKPLETGVRGQYLWFRITNNSRWNIWLEMSGVPKEYGDAKIYYTTEDTTAGGKILVSSRCHVCSINAVAPGRSVAFSIPTDHISRDARLRISYSFDWERENESEGASHSTHSVEFYFSRLPKSALLLLPEAGM